MAELKHPRRIGQSIGAILAGALTGIVLSLGTDLALRSAGIFPALGQPMSDARFLLATAYRTAYGIAGSYLTARFAPSRPMAHALVLGVLGLAANIAGTVTTWDKGPEFGPKWYPLTLVATAIPSAWAGAKLREMQERQGK